MNKKRAAIYVRVSTLEQETDLQEAELREYCGRRGWEAILYRDKGQSGAKHELTQEKANRNAEEIPGGLR